MAEKSKGNEYSVYAGIDDSPPVNWGTIAGTISDQLLAVKKDREAQKAAIDQQTVDQMAQLNKLPDVNDRSLSKILIEGSDRSKQELQMRMKLVKSGAIKPKDYTLFMNEQKNGYSEFSNVIKNWDKWNEKKMESIKNGTASAFDQANALSIEAFGNLQNKTIMTNPANGQLQVVTMLKDKDGKYTKMPNGKTNPENFSAPGTLNSRMAFDEEKKVTSELVNKEVAFIGEEIKAKSLGNGVVETIEDFTQSAAYPDWKKASIAKLTSTDYDIVQILAEDSRYSIASSEAEFKEKNPGVDLKFFIEMDQSGNKPVPKLREGQKEAAEGMVDTLIESQLGRKEDRTRDYKKDKSDREAVDKDTDDIGYIKELDIIMTGDPVDAQAALKRRIDTKNQSVQYDDEKIVSFDITDDQIILRRAKGDPYIIDRRGDTNQEDDLSTPDIDESIKTLSSLDDVITINDVLSPKPLSRGRIQDLIKQENITLGKRRKGNVGTKVGKAEIPAISSGSLNPVTNTSIAADIQSEIDDTARGNSNDKIKGTIEKAITTHMPQALQQEINDNPSLYGKTTIRQDGSLNRLIVTIGGEETRINTNNQATSSEIADKITEAINKAREKVNKKRTSSQSALTGGEITFTSWRKDNPGGKYADFLKAKSKK